MKNFENIKSQWENRTLPTPPSHGVDEILKKVKNLKQQQRYGQVILLLTVLVLVWFFFYIRAYNVSIVMLGLLMMIGALAVRMGIEYLSGIKRNNLNRSGDALSFRKQLKKYYRNRLWVHYLATPLLYALYTIGFVLLLPSFEESLSRGMYLYVLFSFIPILAALAWVIIRQIKKELCMLKSLVNDDLETE
jgi:hypothetical protein